MRSASVTASLCLAALLAGCAAVPAPVPPSPPPLAVSAAIGAHLEREVRWGGMVIDTANFARHSEIEVLAFPLDRQGRPQPGARDLGRFVVLRAGFVDPEMFAPGRFVTVHGRIAGERRGQVGQASYVWPELDAAEMHVWPADFRRTPPRFTFGVGIGIRR